MEVVSCSVVCFVVNDSGVVIDCRVVCSAEVVCNVVGNVVGNVVVRVGVVVSISSGKHVASPEIDMLLLLAFCILCLKHISFSKINIFLVKVAPYFFGL